MVYPPRSSAASSRHSCSFGFGLPATTAVLWDAATLPLAPSVTSQGLANITQARDCSRVIASNLITCVSWDLNSYSEIGWDSLPPSHSWLSHHHPAVAAGSWGRAAGKTCWRGNRAEKGQSEKNSVKVNIPRKDPGPWKKPPQIWASLFEKHHSEGTEWDQTRQEMKG